MTTPYTHTSLQTIEDSGPSAGLADVQQIRFATGSLDAEHTGVTLHRFEPNTRPGLGHRHDAAEEVFVVIGGSGRAKLDDDIVDLATYDAIRVAPPVIRAFEAGPDGLELLAVGPHVAGDGAVFPGWWAR